VTVDATKTHRLVNGSLPADRLAAWVRLPIEEKAVLAKADNELLIRTGSGSPMGGLMKR
jgi:hypothetical protein